MINDERKKAVTQQLAALVEEALIAEVTLSPKPGLVDALDAGAHSDMDYALFLKSAKTLTPFFEEMAQIAWHHAIDQELRERIAEIGRKAEKAMLIATNGINTHKGAIWAMGLL
ncbi:triphosphoribosyl-dephospho-CoA synthase, partial [Enterococcus faecium]